MANIAFTGSHNSTFVVENKGKILLVLELERFLSYKNSGLTKYKIPEYPFLIIEQVLNYIAKHTGISFFENCFSVGDNYVYINEVPYYLNNLIPARNYVTTKHHVSHAASSLYQSSFKEALIFSFDGGGNDGVFNIFVGNRKTGIETLIKKFDVDFGFSYMVIGHYLDDIKQLPLYEGHLIYPGKIMGLVSYGNIKSEWLIPMEEFCYYCSQKTGNTYEYQHLIEDLQAKTGLIFNANERFKGQQAYDIAATWQRAWENVFIRLVTPLIKNHAYMHLPLCLTGGCALNILLNTRIKKEFNREVFIGPIPSDTGLAVGMILNHIKPETAIDITYTGLPLLDIDCISEYINNNNVFLYEVNHKNIIKDIVDGKIIGVARGNSEIGPRGLGNRSILCHPGIKDMKNILNKKVKNREWFRPFSPVVRAQDVSKYFEWEKESQWMSFAPLVKEEWREKLAAVTHVDNTARVQTVTFEQNWWLYNILTEMEAQTGVGVLLNTSFNVNGKPILTTVKDVFNILNNTELDGVIIENYYITKHNINNEYYSPLLVETINNEV